MTTATKSLVVREYQPSDEEAILNLLRISLGENEVNQRKPEFWRWKHINNPFGHSFIRVSCNEETGEIAGLRAFMQWGLHAGERRLRAVRAVDTSTHPDYRRMGIFSTLTKQVVEDVTQDGVDLIFNTPNQYSMPGYLKMGWHYVGAVQPMVRVLNYPRFLWGLASNRLGRVSPGRHPSDSFFKRIPIEVDRVLASSQAVDDLLSRNEALHGRNEAISTVRSAEYLRWRYAEHPNVSYHTVYIEDRSGLSGCAIFRTNTRFGLKEILVTELLMAEPNEKLCRNLIDQIAAIVRADYLIAHFSEDSFIRHALRRSGFRPVPRMGMDFTTRPLNPEMPVDPRSMQSWALSLGDLELF